MGGIRAEPAQEAVQRALGSNTSASAAIAYREPTAR